MHKVNSRVPHNRKIVIGGTSLTDANLKGVKSLKALTQVQDKIEKAIIASGYLEGAPFDFVGVTIRYGLTNDDRVALFGLHEKTLCYEGAVEVDVNGMLAASYEDLISMLTNAALRVVIAIGENFSLPTDVLCEVMDKPI
ncbi:MAG: Imm39 family immunity protein [Erythrobacter sp.]|uniref:Imm39 family immunity protein n=1 Tax=Erythrobacter sp. TaxID=1042 RepID=UPI00329A7EA3